MVEANACPECKLRGATIDWQRFGGCPHGCGYIGEPVEYDKVKKKCICIKERPVHDCPVHGFKEWSGRSG